MSIWDSILGLAASDSRVRSCRTPADQDIAIAPNGHTLALVAYLESVRKGALWIHEVGTLAAKSFGDTAGARFPFWSADGCLQNEWQLVVALCRLGGRPGLVP